MAIHGDVGWLEPDIRRKLEMVRIWDSGTRSDSLTGLLVYHAYYTAKARRCETVEYALKRGINCCSYLRVTALIGWSGAALKHSGTHSGT